MNWNTNVISSAVTGSITAGDSVMPTNNTTLTWAFATGECGSEGWAGLTPTQVASNVQAIRQRREEVHHFHRRSGWGVYLRL